LCVDQHNLVKTSTSRCDVAAVETPASRTVAVYHYNYMTNLTISESVTGGLSTADVR